jgi:CarD family transcriptional regulator
MDFKVGDKAVYPRQGVTEVLGVETKEIMGTRQEFYVLRVLDSDKKIMIPVDKVRSVGLREVMDGEKVEQVFDILRSRSSRGGHGNWNRRYRAYVDKIATGAPTLIAEVLRDLNQLKFSKNLSFGERKMLDTARRLLVQELSVAQKMPASDVETQIESCFG